MQGPKEGETVIRRNTGAFACLLSCNTFISTQRLTFCLRRSVISSSLSLAAVLGSKEFQVVDKCQISKKEAELSITSSALLRPIPLTVEGLARRLLHALLVLSRALRRGPQLLRYRVVSLLHLVLGALIKGRVKKRERRGESWKMRINTHEELPTSSPPW